METLLINTRHRKDLSFDLSLCIIQVWRGRTDWLHLKYRKSLLKICHAKLTCVDLWFLFHSDKDDYKGGKEYENESL